MKTKRHYFCLPLSIANTIVFVTSLIFFVIGFIHSLLVGSLGGTIVAAVLVSMATAAGIVYLIFDGWANWQTDGEVISVSKLFKGTKTVIVSQIISMREDVMETVFVGAIETLDCYEICSKEITIKIPKSQASNALIRRVKNALNASLCPNGEDTNSTPAEPRR